MIKKPFAKFVGLISAGAAYVTGQTQESIVIWLDKYMPLALADATGHIIFGTCLLIVYLAHSGIGTGGNESIHTKPSLTSNMMSR